MRHTNNGVIQIVAQILVLAAPLFLAACSDQKSQVEKPRSLTRLHASGVRIVDAHNQNVSLRGVNLGGWLYAETWITNIDYPTFGRLRIHAKEQGRAADFDSVLRKIGQPQGDDWLGRLKTALTAQIGADASDALFEAAATEPSVYDDSDLPMQQLIEKRFSSARRDELIDAFQEAWVGESDIRWLSEQGINVVRVPIGYRSLISGSFATAPTAMVWNERAFARIQSLLDWCAKYRVYAVIDLQESPGGHNTYSGPALLYGDPASIARTTQIWLEISRRFGERDEIAAYSLLAEPFGAPSAGERDRVYNILYHAIREANDSHLLVIHDGFFGMDTLPNAKDMGWTDVVYSTHLFEWGSQSVAAYNLAILVFRSQFEKAQPTQDVPYYIGSFSTMQDEDFAYKSLALLLDWFEERGYSWSLWTYKRIDDPLDFELWGVSTSWGLRGRLDGQTVARPDLYRDSFNVLLGKAHDYGKLDLKPNPRLLEVLTAATHADRKQLQALAGIDK